MAADRDKALDTALAQIERQFGKGSVMRLGDEVRVPIGVIPTGSIALDVALGIGGLPRGRVVEIYGPESAARRPWRCTRCQRAGRRRHRGLHRRRARARPRLRQEARRRHRRPAGLAARHRRAGARDRRHAGPLRALDIIVIDSVAALVPRAEIEGEMGDSHVGLQARLMSQALRKMTGALANTGTTAIFINQLREKIGVMFGCFSYGTRVTLADGTTEKIGKIVNQKLPVEVMSYDPAVGKIVPKKVVNWFDNGVTDQFLQITVARPGGNGRSQMGVTANHQIRTPGGWREAGELVPGDRVMLAQPHRLSDQQWQVVLGGLMGDGALSPSRIAGSLGTRFRMGHGAKQVEYLDWKASLLGNIEQCRTDSAQGAGFVDCTPLPELARARDVVYFGDGKKHLTDDYLKALTPLALAIWYMDDGCFTLRSKGVQERTRGALAASRSARRDEPGSRVRWSPTCVTSTASTASHRAASARNRCCSSPLRRRRSSSRSSRPTFTRRWRTSCCRSRGQFAVSPSSSSRHFDRCPHASSTSRQAADAVDAPLRHRGRGQPQLLRRRRHGAQQPETTSGGKA
jgi:recombination protein RecA